MKKNYFFALLCLIPVCLFSQNYEDGVNRIYYKDGVLAIERWYSNDKKLDSLKTYYNSGELDEDFHYTDEVFDGLCFKFNKAGEKVTTWKFENGKLIKRVDHILEFNKKDEEKVKDLHIKLKALNDTLKVRGRNLNNFANRAHIRDYLGNKTLALHDFDYLEYWVLKNKKEGDTFKSDKALGNIYDALARIYASFEMDNYAVHYKYKAVESDPENNILIYNLGSYLYTVKSYRLAKIYLNKVLEKWPNHAFTHRLLAALYTDFEDYEKAMYHVNLAFPNEVNLIKFGHGRLEQDIRTIRGYLYHKLGDSEKGIDDLKEAIRLNKDNSFAYRNLGVVYYDLGKYDLACECLNKSKDLGYVKIHDRYDLQAYLDYSCNKINELEPKAQSEIEPIKIIHFSDKPYAYPNPTKDNINIENLSFETFDYQIFDYAGRLVSQGSSTKNNSITFSNMQMGVYILKINNENKVETFRIIKE